MSRLLVLTVLLCTLFVSLSSANYFCMGEPDSIKKDQPCAGSEARCEYGTYCDDAGICSPSVEIGGSCLYNSDCVEGSQCQGVNGKKICVGYAGVGQTCDNNSTKIVPFCAPGYTCDEVEKVCTGGRVGDTCKNNGDVDVCSYTLKCKEGVCQGFDIDTNCTTTSECLPTLFCDESFDQPVCKPRKTSGSCREDHLSCAVGYVCVSDGQFDYDNARCVPERSRKVGQWCYSNQMDRYEHRVCESLRCGEYGFCAAGRSIYTVDEEYCAEDEVFTCQGLIFDDGNVGQCTPNPCYELEKTFGNCIQENCMQCDDPRCLHFEDYNPRGMPGQCYLNHCAEEYAKMRECNGTAQLLGSAFFAALVAFVAAFASRKF